MVVSPWLHPPVSEPRLFDVWRSNPGLCDDICQRRTRSRPGLSKTPVWLCVLSTLDHGGSVRPGKGRAPGSSDECSLGFSRNRHLVPLSFGTLLLPVQ